jgi:alkanesulfonate monooxygenase SsuD/methylene tetrahydromethanopterin reductase-like flavin-dependent oxidoreductase (luciferase family)
MCYAAGKIANEVKAGAMWSDTYGQYMWEHIAAGAQAAGRDPSEVGLVFGPLTAIAEDADEAKQFAKRTLAFYLPYLSPIPEYLGVEAEFVARVQALTGQNNFAAAAELNIMQVRIARSRLAGDPADVHLSPRVGHLGPMDYHRAAEAIAEGESAVERMLPAIRYACGHV